MSSLSATDAADLFRQPPERHLDVGGGEVGYRRVGSGPDVVFVHGFPVNSATFRKLLPHLADHVTCHLLDLPGAGSSRWDESTTISIDNHVNAVRSSVAALGLDDVAVVGHDSGGMIARHAMVGHPALRAMGLIDTEPSSGPSWRFKTFLWIKYAPSVGRLLGWVSGKPRLRRNKFVLGDAFADSGLLEGEFDEFFLQPLNQDAKLQAAQGALIKSFDYRFVDELEDIHQRLDVPVKLVWGRHDVFFPVAKAEAMVSEFPNASLEVVEGAGLFAHEERPAEVAAALLPVLAGS